MDSWKSMLVLLTGFSAVGESLPDPFFASADLFSGLDRGPAPRLRARLVSMDLIKLIRVRGFHGLHVASVNTCRPYDT
jgi:hypothetical protein